MPIVKMPNGQLVDMPDNPSPELLQRFKDHYASMKQPDIELSSPEAPGIGDRLLAAHNKTMPVLINAVDTGLRKGVLGLQNLGLNLGKGIGELGKRHLPESLQYRIPEGEFRDSAIKIRDAIYNYMNPKDPETTEGKVISNLIASTSGGAISPGNTTNNALTGFSGGVGAEAFANTLGDHPLNRILGSLVGSGIHGLATKDYLNRGVLAKEMLSDVKNDDLATAIKNQRDDIERGIPTTLSQAMPTASNIDTYADALANSPQGVNIAKILRDQPYKIKQAAETELAKLPGQQLGPHTIANNAQEAATTVLSTADKIPGKVWTDTFNEAAKTAGTHVPEDTIKSVVKDLVAKRDTYAQATSEYKALNQLIGRFAEVNKATKQPEFLTDASKLHRSLKDFKSSLSKENLANKGMSTSVDKFIGRTIQDVQSKLGEALEPYKKANSAYAEAKKDFLALKQTEIGRIAQRKGAIPGQEAALAPMHNLFKAGTVPGAPSEILHAADKFTEVGRGKDFVNAGKEYLATAISKAGESNNARINDNIAENITRVFGAPQRLDARSQGTKDILVGMARGQGIKEDEAYAKGFMDFMHTVSRAASRPGTVAGTNKASIENLAETSIGKNIGQVSIITPFRQPMLAYARFLKSDALTAMDKALTDPDQVANLILLGKQPTMNKTAQKAILAIITGNVAAHHSNLEDK